MYKNIQYSLKTLQPSYLLASSLDDSKVFDCISICKCNDSGFGVVFFNK